MSSLRREFHVAQQVRREKLRIENRNDKNLMHDEEALWWSQEMMNHQYVPVFPQSSPQWRSNSSTGANGPHDWMDTHSFSLPNVLTNTAADVVLTEHAQPSSPAPTSADIMHYPLYHNGLQDIILNKPSSHHQNAHPTYAALHMVHDPNTATAAPHHQGLSLSLSSNSQSKPSDHANHVGLLPTYRPGVGPLGPFTGYAIILKSSRFLRPCQQLLDEYCSSRCGPGVSNSCAAVAEWVSSEPSGASDHAGASSSIYYYARGGDDDAGSAPANFCLTSSRPECQKNKAKLLDMQEEVTRRYKQYHQQMQMVVSSFETVAGLNSSTPYISLALKSVSRNFRGLKNAISDHLKLLCEALGEDSSMPNASASGKFNADTARLRCMEQSFQRNKSNMELVEPPQHVWRPQRGLPERSVAILKAWLFEHFLHPYPTDTDKHMLATQTGLSRNQVSNWFINARVRVWKPMVEEIHMLETKGGIAGPNHNSTKTGGASASEGSSSHHDHQPHHNDKFGGTHASAMIPEKQFNCLEMGPSSSLLAGENVLNNAQELQWNQDKRSKLECQLTSGMDGSTLMHFMPFRRDGLEISGIGPVSLTLGLRHGVEGAQQLQQEEQIRRHFGGHMIHDFVG